MPEVAYKDIYAEHIQGNSLTRLTQMAMLKNNWDGCCNNKDTNIKSNIVFNCIREDTYE